MPNSFQKCQYFVGWPKDGIVFRCNSCKWTIKSIISKYEIKSYHVNNIIFVSESNWKTIKTSPENKKKCRTY